MSIIIGNQKGFPLMRRTNQVSVVSLVALLASGCGVGATPPRARPLPKPVVLDQAFLQNLITDNSIAVEIHNEGATGLVRIQVTSHRKVGHDVIPGESGVEKTIRESFFREPAPPPKSRPRYEKIDSWRSDVKMEAGKKQSVIIPLPRYNVANMIAGDELSVTAIGVPDPDTAFAPNGSR